MTHMTFIAFMALKTFIKHISVFRKTRCHASFTVEASLLMALILPVLLSILYYGVYLEDMGIMNGAAQEVTARADLNNWKENGNSKLSKTAAGFKKLTGPSKGVSCSVSASRSQVSASYKGKMTLPGLLPKLFGKKTLHTAGSAKRTLFYPADLIRKIRGLEYLSSELTGK